MSQKIEATTYFRTKSSAPESYWTYEKADLEQGAYYRSGLDNKKMAVIFPSDRSQPIDAPGRNARLLVRRFGQDEWEERGTHTLAEAMKHGNRHASAYEWAMDEQVLRQDALHRARKEQETQKAGRMRGRKRGKNQTRDDGHER